MKKIIVLQVSLFILFCSVTSLWGQQTVSEEAKRYFARGMAAVEMAKSPEDYEKAIKEFERSKTLAPDWPDVYFNLGMVQEKSERYRDAIESLKQYLRLAPNATDAAKVREHIYKLEYKAENVLTSHDIADVLVSFGKWEKRGECRWDETFQAIKREGHDRVSIVTFYVYGQERKYSTLKVEGPIVKFTTKVRNWALDPGLIRMFGAEGDPHENQIEVVSREHVIIKQKVTDNRGRTQLFSCEYVKK